MIKKILVAHDLSRRSSAALVRAAELATQTGATLEVLHLVEDDLPAWVVDRRQAEARTVISEEIEKLRTSATADIETTVRIGRDYTDILNRASECAADLIVLGVHREDALRSVVVGTTAERVIGFGSRPVLVVKAPLTGAYRRVLVAIDFTASSHQAATFALELLPEPAVRVVHVAPMAVDTQRSRARDLEKMEKIRAELSARRPGVGGRSALPELVIRHGSPIAEIRNEAAAWRADLLVAGAQRRSGLTRALVGEIPEDLLSRPPCDVLIVHASAAERDRAAISHQLGATSDIIA